MQNQELKAQYEYPTKFNKFKRIMEMRNNSSNSKFANSKPESEKKSVEGAEMSDVSMTTNSSNHVFKQLTISDPPLHSSQPSSLQSSHFLPSYSTSTDSHSSSQPSSNSSATPSIHSSPKKLFINRASDVQDTPLNLTTRAEPMDQSSGAACNNNDNNNNNNSINNSSKNGYRGDDNDSPTAMDTSSLSESMIIEDHFKRSLGSLYNNHTPLKPPPTNNHNSNSNNNTTAAANNNNNNSNNSRTSRITPDSFVHSHENNSPKNHTPKHPPHYPSMQNISPSVLISPFNLSLLTPLATTPLDAVVAAAQLFNNNHNFFNNGNNNNNNNIFSPSNSFINSNNNSSSGNNHTTDFFNSFPPPVYNSKHNVTKQHQQLSPSHKHLMHQQLSPQPAKNSSLHHSSSFHGFKSPSSSSPSPFKSTRRQRYTPPDSYQPYPHPLNNPPHPIISPGTLLHHTNPPPSYEREVRKKTDLFKAPNTSPQASISGSVDDHFTKSLGDVWKQVQATHYGSHTNSRSSHKQATIATTTQINPDYKQHSKQPSDTSKSSNSNKKINSSNSNKHNNQNNNSGSNNSSSNNNSSHNNNNSSNSSSMNRLQTYISEFAPELEDLIPTSVDDHFAKALGDKWLKMQADESQSSSSSSSSSAHSSNSQPLSSLPPSLSHQPPPPSTTSTSSLFRSSPKSMGTPRGGLIISPTTKVKSPSTFYSSPSTFVVRS